MRAVELMRCLADLRQRGVTLIEMIVVIVVSGILLSITGMFVRNQVIAYSDVARRAELADIADGALRRIARDVQNSGPNSVRPSATDSTLIELVPIVSAGRFGSQDGLILSSPLTIQSAPITIGAGQSVVVCNTGQDLADVYSGGNRRPLATGTAVTSLTFSGGDLTDYCSSNRFQVVSQSVVYAFESAVHTLWRFSGCSLTGTQRMTIADLTANCTGKAMLAGSVDSASFNFSPNIIPSLGILTARLVLAAEDAPDERVTLLHQINVLNSP